MAGQELEQVPEKPVVVQSYTRSAPTVRHPNKVVLEETWTREEPPVTETYSRRTTTSFRRK